MTKKYPAHAEYFSPEFAIKDSKEKKQGYMRAVTHSAHPRLSPVYRIQENPWKVKQKYWKIKQKHQRKGNP